MFIWYFMENKFKIYMLYYKSGIGKKLHEMETAIEGILGFYEKKAQGVSDNSPGFEGDSDINDISISDELEEDDDSEAQMSREERLVKDVKNGIKALKSNPYLSLNAEMVVRKLEESLSEYLDAKIGSPDYAEKRYHASVAIRRHISELNEYAKRNMLFDIKKLLKEEEE